MMDHWMKQYLRPGEGGGRLTCLWDLLRGEEGEGKSQPRDGFMGQGKEIILLGPYSHVLAFLEKQRTILKLFNTH